MILQKSHGFNVIGFTVHLYVTEAKKTTIEGVMSRLKIYDFFAFLNQMKSLAALLRD